MYKSGDKVEVNSRMGGTFTVRLVCQSEKTQGTWFAVIDMPRNPDFHNQNWICRETEIR